MTSTWIRCLHVLSELYAYFDRTSVGVFRQSAQDGVTFEYWEDAPGTPVSLSLPREGPAAAHSAYNYLSNLLPDRSDVRERWKREANLPSADVFDLLAEYGEDVSGALTISPDPDLPARQPQRIYPVTEDDIAERIIKLRMDSTSWNDPRTKPRRSLGGAQGKFSLAWVEGTWVAPTYEVPSTHIFKPPSDRHRDQDVAEHVSLEMACEIGLRASGSSVMEFKGERTFVTQRWDRADGRRLHVEDLAQALGRKPVDKYDYPAERVAALLKGFGEDREFVRQLAYNLALGNTDAHLKNYSVYLSADDVRLAPLYDAAPEVLWHDNYPDRLAMPVSGASNRDQLVEKRWRFFANDAGLDADQVLEEVFTIGNQVAERLPEKMAQYGITDSHRQQVLQVQSRLLQRTFGTPAGSFNPSGRPPQAHQQ